MCVAGGGGGGGGVVAFWLFCVSDLCAGIGVQGFLDADLLYPTEESEKQKHKLHRLVQAPNSYFLDVKCANCYAMYVSYHPLVVVVVLVGHQQSSLVAVSLCP